MNRYRVENSLLLVVDFKRKYFSGTYVVQLSMTHHISDMQAIMSDMT